MRIKLPFSIDCAFAYGVDRLLKEVPAGSSSVSKWNLYHGHSNSSASDPRGLSQ
jgi:hypothetical protein